MMETLLRCIKNSKVWLLPPLESSHEKGEFSQWNLGCSSLVEGILASKKVPWELLLLLILRTHRMPCPLPLHPVTPVKMTPTASGRAGTGRKKAPLSITGSPEVQRGTPWNQPFCRGNLLVYPASAPPLPLTGSQASFVLCVSRARPKSILLGLVSTGLVPNEVRVLGHRANAVAVTVGSLPAAFSLHAHLPGEFPLSFLYHTVPSLKVLPMCLHIHTFTLNTQVSTTTL